MKNTVPFLFLLLGIADFSFAARAESIVNVKDFGAKGDGSDATAGIARAIQKIPPAGGTLFFPAGNYLISATNLLPSNTHMRCEADAVIMAAPAASWVHGITVGFGAVTGSNFEISGCRFSFPFGTANYGGGYAHILQFTGVSNVSIHHNVFDGGGDAVSEIGTTTTWEISNTVTNVSHSCFDHWGGFTNAHTNGNYCTTLDGEHNGVSAIRFSGINTDQTPADSVGFEASGNTVYMNSTNGQCFEIDGGPSGSSDNDGYIVGNICIVTGDNADWGVQVSGNAGDGEISGNLFENNSWTYSAVGVFAPATNWDVHDNIAINWSAGTLSAFENMASGRLEDNQAYSNCADAPKAVQSVCVK